MIITDITTEIIRKHVMARMASPGNSEPKIRVYIDDATFNTMRRESAEQDALDPHVNELIMQGTLLGCQVHQVYGKDHGWRVFVA